MNPKVFVCHASEDKDRFVLDFASKLRAKGIDAWVDKWEIYPGDSLVDKIFEEGIKNASAIIVVLSRYSIAKRWVREELNASVVKKIEKGTRLIPVLIDDCEVPESLKSTVWERISDTSKYDAELNRIVMAIYGQHEKPELGPRPKYAETILDTIPGLTKLDTLVLKIACETAIRIGCGSMNAETMRGEVQSRGIPNEEFKESLDILDGRGYLRGERNQRNEVVFFTITPFGFGEYAIAFIPDYSRILEKTAYLIVNENLSNSLSISTALNQPKLIVTYALRSLGTEGLIRFSESTVGDVYISHVSPELRRRLRGS
jgi:hypothetical protein